MHQITLHKLKSKEEVAILNIQALPAFLSRPISRLVVTALVVTALAVGVSAAALPAWASPSGELWLYTSQPDIDAARTAQAFEAAYPDVKVQLFRSGTEEVISRFLLEAEAGSPRADVLLVADAATFELLKERDLLETYVSPLADEIDATYYDQHDHTYYGTKILATVIAYNTILGSPVQSWKELADLSPRQLVMPSPNYSGAAAYNLGVFTRTNQIGWEWYERLQAAQTMLTPGNGGVLQAVASGERPYGIIVDFMAIRAQLEGSPIAVVYPDEGVPLITEPVGIVKGTQNLEAAQAFVDFLLSEQGQTLAADMGYMPLSAAVAPPEGFPSLSELKVLTADPALLAATREDDKAQFGRLFGE